MMHCKKWSEEEVSFLASNINKLTYKDFSKKLNRTVGSIKNKATKMRILKEDPLKIGTTLNYLTLIDIFIKNIDKRRYRMLMCRCVCGNTIETHRISFLKGSIKSCGCRRGKEPGAATWNAMYRQYKHDAKKRKWVFDINIEQFKNICSCNCSYCNREPKLTNHYVDSDGNHFRTDVSTKRVEKSWVKANGIDRIDSSIGYVITNCVVCCTTCNRMKSYLTKEEFLKHIENIYNFSINKGK